MQHLLNSTSGSQLIDEIWSWESVQHGDTAILNADNLTGICKVVLITITSGLTPTSDAVDWRDNGRDILNFLLNYLPSTVTPAVLPTHLSRLPATESERRKTMGYNERTIVVVGHSFGGCTT